MKATLWITTTFGLGILLGHLITPANAQFRTVKTTRLLATELADWCNGKEVTIELIEAGPGTSGKHYHPGHSFTYVLDGSEAYALDGQSSKTVHPGDILHEAPMQVHAVDNMSPVKLLVVRVIEKGGPASVRLP
jgi:quercetin dioxygenase-like cupin family protein